jgi:hypothetical protein
MTLASWFGRFAPYVLLAAIFGALATMLVCLGLTRRQSNTLEPGLLTALGAVGLLAWPFLKKHTIVRAVEVYADGLAWEDADGRHRVAWDDVVSLRRKPKLLVNGIQAEGDVTLGLRGGRTVVFDFTLEDYDELADLLQRVRAVQLLPGLLAELERRPLAFGPVTIDRGGLTYQGHYRPWESFEYAVDSGSLVLVPPGGQFTWNDRTSICLAEVPDCMALVELMARAGKLPIHPARTLPAGTWNDLL